MHTIDLTSKLTQQCNTWYKHYTPLYSPVSLVAHQGYSPVRGGVVHMIAILLSGGTDLHAKTQQTFFCMFTQLEIMLYHVTPLR